MYETRNITKWIDATIVLGIKKCRHFCCTHCKSNMFYVDKTYSRSTKDYKDQKFDVHYCVCNSCGENFVLAPPIFLEGTMFSSMLVLSVLLEDDDVPSSEIAERFQTNARIVRKWRKIYKDLQQTIRIFFYETGCSNGTELFKMLMNDVEREKFLLRHPGMILPFM